MGFSRPEEQKCGVFCEQYTLVLFYILSCRRTDVWVAWDWDSMCVHTDLYGGDDGAKIYT